MCARIASTNGHNKLRRSDRAPHAWYRFVLSFPPHLVRDYLRSFNVGPSHRVLDPFCGTGTVLVECRKLGIPSVGVEVNPVLHFASQTKLDWSPDPGSLVRHARLIALEARNRLAGLGFDDCHPRTEEPGDCVPLRCLPPEAERLLLTGSISPLPLHRALVLKECMQEHYDPVFSRHEMLALADVLVHSISNLHFGPEVGISSPKVDTAVVEPWIKTVEAMADDLQALRLKANGIESRVYRADARNLSAVLERNSIDAVITSPPYPNEKDYSRTTRLELVLLDLVHNLAELRALKKGMIRSNTRGVYKEDDDDSWSDPYPEIQRIAEQIEHRRIEMGKTSGFERLYSRVTKLYFGGMARHLAELRPFLRPGARLAYVVGDQASYLQVMIQTGKLLAGIANSLGYEVERIDLFRTRLATATKKQLREEVVVLRWPGDHSPEGDRCQNVSKP